MYSFVVIEYHPIVRIGICDILIRNFKNITINTAHDESELIETLNAGQVDFIVVGPNVPNMGPDDLVTVVKNVQPNVNLIAITPDAENFYSSSRYYKKGINALVCMNEEEKDFVEAVSTVLAGNIYISNTMIQTYLDVSEEKKYRNPFDQLSAREYQIAVEYLKGKKTAEIASSLNLKASTVGSYKSRIFDKLALRDFNMIELMKLALQHNVILLDSEQ